MNLRRLLSLFREPRRSESSVNELAAAVFEAAEMGDVATLIRVRDEHGAQDLRQDSEPNQLTTLHVAAASGSREVVDLLLSDAINSDPKAARVNNFTPLHAAAMHGHTAICEVLVRAGAEVNVQTEPQKYAPLHSAAYGGHVDTIRLLLAHGADQYLLNYRSERAIDTARRQNQSAAIAVLEEGSE